MKKFISLLASLALIAQLASFTAYAQDIDLSEEVDEDNVIDVLTGDIDLLDDLLDDDGLEEDDLDGDGDLDEDDEEEVDDLAEELVEDAVEDLVDNTVGQTDDEVAVMLKALEAKIDAEIADLKGQINELGDTANDLDLKRRLLRRIRHLHDLKIKFRARILNLRRALQNRLKRVYNRRGVFQVRWGNLSRERADCITDDVEDLSSFLDDNSREVIPGCESERVDYSGSIAADRGDLNVRRQLLFEDNDEVTKSSGDSIEFNSVIAGHWDGLIVRYTPPSDIAENQEVLNVTVDIGSLHKTFTLREIVGRHDIGNGNQIEFKRSFQMLPGVAKDLQDEVLRERDKIEGKVEQVQEKIHRFRLLRPRRDGIKSDVLDRQLDNLNELEDLVEDAADYVYDELGSTQLQDEINSLLTNFDEDTSGLTLAEKIRKFRARVKDIRTATHQRKFEQGLIPFKDTDDGEWYTEFVSTMKNKNIISGYKTAGGAPLGEFRPGNNITVAEILKVALETAEKGQSDEDPRLRSAIQHWASGYVRMAEELDLDLVDGDVDLDRPATRGEVIRLILEALRIRVNAVRGVDFSDVSASHEHADFIQFAKELGIISGDEGTSNFRPDDPVNRAEVAKIISKILESFFGN